MSARIELERAGGRYQPGQTVSGTVSWSCPTAPIRATCRLRWLSEGKGSPDGNVVASEAFAAAGPNDHRTFRFDLPSVPYSFSGKVLSIVWQVELVLQMRGRRKEETAAIRRITMSPTGDPIDPYRQ